MVDGRSKKWSAGLIGADRDAAALAERARSGTSLVLAGPRGSGRSYLLRTIAEELGRQDALCVELRTSGALADVAFGAMDASGNVHLAALRDDSATAVVPGVVVVDDVDSLDAASMRTLARGIAAHRLTAVIGLRTARARSIDHPDDSDVVRRTVLDLWLDGLADRVDLSELSNDDALKMISLFPDADLLDSSTRAGIAWRADGSRTLLRQLIIEAVHAARAGRDPLAALQTAARDSRLAIALSEHVADFPQEDLICLAGVRRLPHLESAVATRLFDAESVRALVAGGLLHADASVDRRLTANDLVAQESQRRLGTATVDAILEAAGKRMLTEADEWWSPAVAVFLSERWHRLGIDASGETEYSPELRARVALDAAREANDRGDTAHAAAHAARGLRAMDDPQLRLEARLAAAAEAGISSEPAQTPEAQTRRRIARSRAARAVRGPDDERANAAMIADARIDVLLRDAVRAASDMDWARAAHVTEEALTESAASPAARLRALIAASSAQTFRGDWRRAQEHHRSIERILDAPRRPEGISVRERLMALLIMLAGHQIAGADGTAVRERLEREVGTSVREGRSTDLSIAGAASAIAFACVGHPDESQREFASAMARDPWAVTPMDAAMIELGVADELATAGRTEQARTILSRLRTGPVPLLTRTRLYVETTILTAEGRADEARRAARAVADLSFGRSAAALRIRDLFRLVTLGEARDVEVDELVQLAATTDLPLAVAAVRRAAARNGENGRVPVDDLRLHDLWSAPDTPSSPTPVTALRDATRDVPGGTIDDLTAREYEIALLAGQGLTNREIAKRLFLSIRTVESHVYQARMKIGAPSRRDLGRRVADASRVGAVSGVDG
ncbi:DNA-binding CsgD family transcriptional regulator [Microbacterium sp. 1154]|uniref:helix-turn-helix transcriptional regulator n=1 Tax=Microbacterium sp. 1154 TaxID=2817733 RepID=UPI002861711A|nr:LuxR family transcriptional regulator [Microbacterium sp. 1154]MDR6690703.1 DNA-binding CsgD family transcriptional regulator [Microbacterium sp. 1154]